MIGVGSEWKIAGFIQNRLRPMEVGYKGQLKAVADALKLIQKEEIIVSAIEWVWILFYFLFRLTKAKVRCISFDLKALITDVFLPLSTFLL